MNYSKPLYRIVRKHQWMQNIRERFRSLLKCCCNFRYREYRKTPQDDQYFYQSPATISTYVTNNKRTSMSLTTIDGSAISLPQGRGSQTNSLGVHLGVLRKAIKLVSIQMLKTSNQFLFNYSY